MPDKLDTARHYLRHAQDAADAIEKGRASREMAPVEFDHALRMVQAYALLSIAESLASHYHVKRS